MVITGVSGGIQFSSVQFSSVSQSCLTFCDSMNCSTPGLPVHHQLPEFIQTHVHGVGDAIEPYDLDTAYKCLVVLVKRKQK